MMFAFAASALKRQPPSPEDRPLYTATFRKKMVLMTIDQTHKVQHCKSTVTFFCRLFFFPSEKVILRSNRFLCYKVPSRCSNNSHHHKKKERKRNLDFRNQLVPVCRSLKGKGVKPTLGINWEATNYEASIKMPGTAKMVQSQDGL